VVHKFLTTQCKNYVRNSQRWARGISEKGGPEATASFASPNIHPWTCLHPYRVHHPPATSYGVSRFPAREINGTVFIDLTVAYGTAWHCNLTCKLLKLLCDSHMLGIIIELVKNLGFTLVTSSSKRSRLQGLKNDDQLGSVLAMAPFRHLLLWLANYSFQDICIRWWHGCCAC